VQSVIGILREACLAVPKIRYRMAAEDYLKKDHFGYLEIFEKMLPT
jgi:hypothetical protein